jgi:thioredoxin-like negative regulator of GroEL
VVLGKIDGTQNQQVSEKYRVTAFPTLMLFAGVDLPVGYRGDRTAQAIGKWLEEMVGF